MSDPSSDPPRQASANASASSLEALSLTDSAAARIADQINSGVFRPGQRLPSERTLATELTVSRPALREALRALQSAGLVQARRGSGWYVLEHGSDAGAVALANWMQMQPTGDIVAVRRVLEPEAIRDVPATRVADLANETDAILKEMRRALRDGAHEEAAQLHSRFHRALVQYASTRLARTLLASMIDAAQNAQLEIFRTPRASVHSFERHRWIVEALEDGDMDEAARRVAEHLEPAFTYPRETPRTRSTGARG
jgi:GntR family transcriptional regulator, transcriptional repressor for pyruvate dehydrogenase complex